MKNKNKIYYTVETFQYLKVKKFVVGKNDILNENYTKPLNVYHLTETSRRVSLVEQELLTLPEHMSSPTVFSRVLVTRTLVFFLCSVPSEDIEWFCIIFIKDVIFTYYEFFHF
jgi:hypothetical protein